MTTTRTDVSKANPTIKKILANTVGAGWKGRHVTVVGADLGWEYTRYIDDRVQVFDVYLASMSGHPSTLRPTYGGPPIVYPAPQSGHALVLHESYGGKDIGVKIVVSSDALDEGAIEIAIDALLMSDAKGANAALASLGPARGVAMAVAEARAKARDKGAIAPGARGAKRSAAQLQREIEAVTGRRVR